MKKLISKSIGFSLNTLAIIAPGKAASMGFNLFCYPFRAKLTDKHKAFLFSAERSTLEHEGETIQVYKWGSGKHIVLMLHGWQSHTFRWKNYIESLDTAKYTIYALDAPGHGLSSGKFMTVPLYSEVVELFLNKVGKVDIVLSHSIGSFTAIYTFHRLAHLSPTSIIALAPPGEAEDFFNFYTNTLGLSPRTVKLIVDYFEAQIKKTPSYFSAHKFASTLTSKGLLIHDEEDADTSVENSKRIHSHWKNSTLVITKGYGHNLRSENVIRQVVDFVEESSKIKSAQLS
jgi:pimeloyl-ACP methyl ester carboxylesterase